MTDFENSRIEKLKRALYSRDESQVPKDNRGDVSNEDLGIPKSWGENHSFSMPKDAMTKKNNSFFNKFLIFSVVFFLISIGIASFIFFGGFNMISSSNVDIKVLGSNTVSSGEEIDLNISIINQNRTDLENAVLYIEYPDGVSQLDEIKNSRVKVNIGTLAKGNSTEYPARILVLGEKDAIKTIKFKLEYTVSGSNATFSKEKDYDISINSSPILLEVSYPKEINSGQEVVFNISLTSNSNIPMVNTLLKMEYPYGFTYTDSSIKPIRDNSIWRIGDLKNGDKKTLVVKGVLVGQNMEDRSFRISVGLQSDDVSKDFDTDLAVNQITLGIRKSFFDLIVRNNTDPNDKGVNIDQTSQVVIDWQNTLPDRIVNTTILAKISGNVFDKTKVMANNGYYKSLDGTIFWDRNTTESLKDIAPGREGSVAFSLGTLSSQSVIRLVKNPHINIEVEMVGERTGLDASTITSTAKKTIKFNSNLNLVAKSYRNIGGISNTGPIPPKVDRESTYTIKWTISNTTNDLKDVYVVATLPIGVSWGSETTPQVEKISYNSDSRTVTWNLGAVSSGVGYSYAPREVAFKVSVLPNATQVGQVLNLVDQVNAYGIDTYTGGTLRSSSGSVTTQVSDPGFPSSGGAVSN